MNTTTQSCLGGVLEYHFKMLIRSVMGKNDQVLRLSLEGPCWQVKISSCWHQISWSTWVFTHPRPKVQLAAWRTDVGTPTWEKWGEKNLRKQWVHHLCHSCWLCMDMSYLPAVLFATFEHFKQQIYQINFNTWNLLTVRAPTFYDFQINTCSYHM